MQFKLVALLLPFCLFQVILSSSLTPEDKIKLIEAEEELIIVVYNTAFEMSLVEDGVKKQVIIVEDAFIQVLKEFDEEVKEAEKEAVISGKDIQKCVDTARASSKALGDKLHSSLRDCKNTMTVREVELEFNRLRNLKYLFANAEAKCETEVDASKCVDVLIKDLNEIRDGLAASILKILQTVDVDSQFDCISSVNDKLNSELYWIKYDWLNCINQK